MFNNSKIFFKNLSLKSIEIFLNFTFNTSSKANPDKKKSKNDNKIIQIR